MELCDTHCHIQSAGARTGERTTRELWSKAGDVNPDDIIKRANEVGVNKIICVGCDLPDSQLAISFVQPREGCWASVGIHPHEASHYVADQAARQEFAELTSAPKVIAIGECGLDYHYTFSPREAQVEVLKFQFELAQKNNLAMIFHVREAYDDFWPIFETYHRPAHPIRGVLHSFTDSAVNLERAISHGLLIGVNGISTFTKQLDQIEVYRTIPINNLILETDAPFLTPSPDRGKICEPYHISVIAKHLAELRKSSVSSLAEATTQNAQRLFGI